MTRYLIAIILFVIIGYGLVKALPLLSGPTLSVVSPKEYATITSGIVTVSGDVKRIAELTLNGAPILHNENGHFSTTLTFPRGTSILTLTASDLFGRHITITRTIFVPN